MSPLGGGRGRLSSSEGGGTCRLSFVVRGLPVGRPEGRTTNVLRERPQGDTTGKRHHGARPRGAMIGY